MLKTTSAKAATLQHCSRQRLSIPPEACNSQTDFKLQEEYRSQQEALFHNRPRTSVTASKPYEVLTYPTCSGRLGYKQYSMYYFAQVTWTQSWVHLDPDGTVIQSHSSLPCALMIRAPSHHAGKVVRTSHVSHNSPLSCVKGEIILRGNLNVPYYQLLVSKKLIFSLFSTENI